MSVTKVPIIVEYENKMLKHQIDEMEFVTRKTLQHIKQNIIVGQEVAHTLNGQQWIEKKPKESPSPVPAVDKKERPILHQEP